MQGTEKPSPKGANKMQAPPSPARKVAKTPSGATKRVSPIIPREWESRQRNLRRERHGRPPLIGGAMRMWKRVRLRGRRAALPGQRQQRVDGRLRRRQRRKPCPRRWPRRTHPSRRMTRRRMGPSLTRTSRLKTFRERVAGFSFSASTTLVLELPGGWLDFPSLVVQLQYWNNCFRRPTGFSLSGSTGTSSPRPAGFSVSGSATLILERPSLAAGWTFLLW